MRDIRFRVWDDNKKKMLSNAEPCNPPTVNEWGNKSFEIIHNGYIKLMQYTGLDDKNGKPIFEGDVVRWNKDDEQISEVRFRDASFCHYFSDVHEHFDINESNLYEVIGNNYENPELLDKQT